MDYWGIVHGTSCSPVLHDRLNSRLVLFRIRDNTLFLHVQIPVGARFIGIPGTESTENPRGTMVEVYWQQDDSGALCISGYSDSTPIPPHVQLPTASTHTSNRNTSGRQRQVYGIVIDPSQVDDSDSR